MTSDDLLVSCHPLRGTGCSTNSCSGLTQSTDCKKTSVQNVMISVPTKDESPKSQNLKLNTFAEFTLLKSIGVACGANLVCSTKEQ